MSHPQAFHTSCRRGLSGAAGFQINAASASLDRETLAALSKDHARYDTPSDLPFEPTAEDMTRFPVALKMSVVPDVGPVVSRTTYVGREYRGRHGAPDEGRFGNFFCHLVVGTPGGDPFDGLNAVELWEAPHWTTDEADSTSLPELGPLVAGALDLERSLDTVTAAPAGVAAALVDSALAAADGGPPLLIVEPVVIRTVDWFAWLNCALPPSVACGLTFSTFEGRPQDVLGLHVVATTPACDPGVSIAGRFARVDVTAEPTEPTPSLYARVACALASEGAEAVGANVRRITAVEPSAWGAELAVMAGRLDLVQPAELPSVLTRVSHWVRTGCLREAADALSSLAESTEADRASLSAWADLHACARLSGGSEPAREISTAALGRLVTHLDLATDSIAAVSFDAPAVPRVGPLGVWLRALEAAAGTSESGRLVGVGLRLGLLGLNVPVDDRAAAVVVADLDRPDMIVNLDGLAACPSAFRRVVDTELAEWRPDRRRRLLVLGRLPEGEQILQQRAGAEQTFTAFADYLHVRVARDPSTRSAAARKLVTLATTAEQQSDVRRLWGGQGPQNDREVVELVAAYTTAGCEVPPADVEHGFRMLMQMSLPTRMPAEDGLGFRLCRLPGQGSRPEALVWKSALRYLSSDPTGELATWAQGVRAALDAGADRVPDDRWSELTEAAALTLDTERASHDFADALRVLYTGSAESYEAIAVELGRLYARRLRASANSAAAAAGIFTFWIRQGALYADSVLPRAFADLSGRNYGGIRERLVPPMDEEWDDFDERNPRRGSMSRVLRRRGGNG